MPMDFFELPFADGTLLFAAHGASTEALLQSVEAISARYGLMLNRDKCAMLAFGTPDRVAFLNGERLPVPKSTVYLGSTLNNKGDPMAEVNR